MTYDDIVVGAGHNGLTAAAYLARAGRRVLVLERADYVGGAAVSSRAFPGVDARLSRYSYLVSLLPKQVLADLDLDVRMQRRRYSSYTPLTQGQLRGLLIDDEDDKATAAAFAALTGSGKEFAAWRGFYDRCRSVAARIFPTVLEPLRSSAQMRDLAGDDELWSALVERPVGALLRDRFSDDTVRGIVATDALIGTFADLDSASLVQNVCLLYHLMGGGTEAGTCRSAGWARSPTPWLLPPRRPAPRSSPGPRSPTSARTAPSAGPTPALASGPRFGPPAGRCCRESLPPC